ncbi:MAG: CHAT domain-containing protein [Ardenticatenaceae bacterium]|nr:CHAT domain-containing protein [Ardenticatenaceae bacterium]
MQFDTLVTRLHDGTDNFAMLLIDNTQRTQFISELKAQIYLSWPNNAEHALELAQLLYQLEEPDQRSGEITIPVEVAAAIAVQLVDPTLEPNSQLYETELANAVVGQLKQMVDKLQWRDKEQAIAHAEAIIRLGEFCQNPRHMALGEMVLGDCIAQLGNRLQEAWEWNGRAANRYLQDGDLVGWARTCIGKIGVCIELDRIGETEKTAVLAHRVLQQFNEYDLMIRLAINLMKLQSDLGRYDQTIAIFEETLPLVTKIGIMGEIHLGYLYNNVGIAYLYQSEFHQAKHYYELAEAVWTQQNKLVARDVVYQSLAYIDRMHGNYREALKRLHGILRRMTEQQSIYKVHVQMHIVECYFFLNRIEEAYTMAIEMMRGLAQLHDAFPNDLAQALRYLGMAQGRLGLYERAEQRFEQAIDIFTSLQAEAWRQFTRLLRGELALLQDQFLLAQTLGKETAVFFAETGQRERQTRALMLQAQAAFGLQEWRSSAGMGRAVWQHAKMLNNPILLYRAHLLLGKISRENGRYHQAKRHFLAANLAIWRLRGQLTISLRGDFMADKSEALHAHLQLLFQQNQTVDAYEIVERGKSQLLRQYLNNRQRLLWQPNRPAIEALLAELNRAKEAHHRLYRQVHEHELLKDNEPKLSSETAQEQLAICERQIRSLIEQLDLSHSDNQPELGFYSNVLARVQQQIPDGAFVAEFYTDGDKVSVFVVEHEAITAVTLPIAHAKLSEHIERLLFNIRCALYAGDGAANLLRVTKLRGQKLYDGLFAPLQPWLERYRQVILVPYGILHYLPFNILHNGNRYFVETHELVTLPAATLLLRSGPKAAKGALLLGYSDNGRLPHINTEVTLLGQQLETAVCIEEACTKAQLNRPPKQILHIAAHGKHRLDQPDLSFIDLADGKLFIDDLLQQDLGYELVVLSACETGLATVKPGEELIGFGRSVLLAGAGALVASLWQVDDQLTAKQMGLFYQALQRGESKTAALQAAQVQLLQQQPDLHPAFWGAFQLVGNPDRLSVTNLVKGKTHHSNVIDKQA